jgi:hypothetical protein
LSQALQSCFLLFFETAQVDLELNI